jgi:hypothetical protein
VVFVDELDSDDGFRRIVGDGFADAVGRTWLAMGLKIEEDVDIMVLERTMHMRLDLSSC